MTNESSLMKQAFLAIQDLEVKLEKARHASKEPIAVIGLGCRFPGGARDSETFWELLRSGRDAISTVPSDRWDADAYFDPDPDRPGTMVSRHGAFIDRVDEFDEGLFEIAPREAAALDPQQRLALQLAWETLENAGYAPLGLQGTKTGVFLGIAGGDFGQMVLQAGRPELLNGHFVLGISRSVAAGRISYVLGLQGPSIALDTACSSSLVAVHTACQSLRSGDCNLALAGGVNLMLSPDTTSLLSRLRMLSPEGKCRTFDEGADGFVRGEGCGLVALKLLSQAEADRDRILAVIRGSAVNQDGASSSLTAPNGPSQEALMRQALESAGLSPHEVSYIEAHGTGTPLGDPIELQAIGAVYGAGRPSSLPLMTGSLKTNMGHLESAAGVAGLIKTILALQHRQIPPHLHLSRPTSRVNWSSLGVTVPQSLKEWKSEDMPRIAAVSSFGFSGTNAHVIVQEPPAQHVAIEQNEWPVQILTASAKNEGALRDVVSQYGAYLETHPNADLRDVCFTANTGRSHFSCRASFSASDVNGMREALAAFSVSAKHRGKRSDRLCFLYTGQGSQYAGMGEELYRGSSVYREAVDRCAAAWEQQTGESLDAMLRGPGEVLKRAQKAQPALFAVEYGLSELWRSWGVEPSLLLGHSLGEYVAAVVAGVFSLEDGLRLVRARAELMDSLSSRGVKPGGMRAVQGSAERVRPLLRGLEAEVGIAAINGPESVVISGAEERLEELGKRLEELGLRTRALEVTHAFHSPLLEPILEEFERRAQAVRYSEPRLRLISNLTGRVATGREMCHAGYWREHMRSSVQFHAGVQTALASGCSSFLEIGPQPHLLTLGKLSAPQAEVLWLPSIRKGRNPWIDLLGTVRTLYEDGFELDWAGIHARCGRKIALPTYPFERHRYPVPKPAAAGVRSAPEQDQGHPLLGTRLNSPLEDEQFQAEISPESPAYLAHHSVNGKPVVPAAAYLEIAFSAANALGLKRAAVRAAAFLQPCIFDVPRRLQCILRKSSSGRTFAIYSSELGTASQPEWLLHATGEIAADLVSQSLNRVDIAELRRRCGEDLDPATFYQVFEGYGLNFGPAFRPLTRIHQGTREALIEFAVPSIAVERSDAYAVHPVALDACVQAVAAAVMTIADSKTGLQLPSGIEELAVLGDCRAMTMAHAVLRESGDGQISADFRGFDRDGNLFLIASGLTLRALQLPRASLLDTSSYEMDWCALPSDIQPLEIRGHWAVIGPEPLSSDFAALLRDRETLCSIVPQSDLAAYRGGYEIALRRVAAAAPLTDVIYIAPDSGADGTRDRAEMDSRALQQCLQLMQAALAGNAAPDRFWIVTRGGQGSGITNLSHALLWGFGRSVALEHPEMRTIRVDLDPLREPEAEQLLRLARSAAIEDELVLRDGSVMVPRLRRSHAKQNGDPAASAQSNMQLAMTHAGTIDGLQLLPATRREPLAGEIEIEIRAAGLNFRDVLNVLGMYKGKPGPIGGECAGIITRVGPEVEDFQPGDEVLALGRGCFGNFLTTDVKLVWRKPQQLSFAAAVTIPIAFLTAEYSLRQVARVQRGESVLIHAGAGGVGLAAIQIAQRIGAVVFATAGSEEKRRYLRSLGVGAVTDSRSLDFANKLQEATAARGVDVVLNSLIGPFIDASIRSLAPGGRFVELGVADLRSVEAVKGIRPDISYSTVDLASEIEAGSSLVHETVGALIEQFERSELEPLPRKIFALEQAHDAFRYMAQARHIGRVVLAPPVSGGFEVRRDAAYLVTGGMSGLGLKVAASLGARGAGEVIVMGRKAPSAEATAVFNAMRAAGTAVTVRQGDVAREQDVALALQTDRKLRGIFHCAGILDDGALLQQTWDRFESVLAPKAQGAWHLHRLTRSAPLDCFVLFSSVAGMFGSPGQSNYASANAFLDALAQLRGGLQLPAVSIAWGAWTETGMAVRHSVVERGSAAGLMGIATPDGLEAMHALAGNNVGPHIMVAPVDWSRYFANELPAGHRKLLSGLRDSAGSRPATTKTPSRHESWLPKLQVVARSHWKDVIAALIEERIQQTLQLDRAQSIPPDQPLQELGLDSLLSIELRNALGVAIDRALPATLLFNYPTLDALTECLVHELGGDGAPRHGVGIAPKPDHRSLLDDIEALSDDEVNQLLGEKSARGAL